MLSNKKQSGLSHFEMKLRLENKIEENAAKPQLVSSDVVDTGDFVFSKIEPNGRVGDSGALLLAKRKTNRKEMYLVKHEYCDCACNEYIYTKLVQAMGYKMPDAKLFRISPDEKRRYFKTEYILGTRFINITHSSPPFSLIKKMAANWRDYFSFAALCLMTDESDSTETPLADDGFIYRVDTTAAFPISNYYLSSAGINIEINGVIPKDVVKSHLEKWEPNDRVWNFDMFDTNLNRLIETYGDECIEPFLEPFARIQDISQEYIDDFLNTLCYFYPDFIGDFFKRYLRELQRFSCSYSNFKRER